MTNIALFGSGRWGRVHASVLQQLMNEDDQLIWLSRHGQQDALRQVIRQENTVICGDLDTVWEHTPHCCIIATAPDTHAYYAGETIKRRLPTLIEKPICLEQAEFEYIGQLSKKHACPVGINLVFLHASYLHEFAAKAAHLDIRSIEVTWHDTVSETRYGEEKTPDYFTYPVDDMFPHCWSVLHMFHEPSSFSPTSASAWADGRIALYGNLGAADVSVSLSRFHTHRQRRVCINGELLLDFSEEPGFTVVQQEKKTNHWSGDRPMKSSLADFLDIARGRASPSAWPQALGQCAGSFLSTLTARRLARSAQFRCLASYAALADNQLLDEASNLLLDLFLPQHVSVGLRPPILSKRDRQEFSALALSQYRNGKLDEPN